MLDWLPTQSKDRVETPAGVHLVADHGHVRLCAGIDERLPGLVARGDRLICAEHPRQRHLMRALGLRDQVAGVAQDAKGPDRGKGDRAASDHKNRPRGPKRATSQHTMDADGKRLRQHGNPVGNLVGYREDLPPVCDDLLAPTARKGSVIADGQPRCQPHRQGSLLARHLAGGMAAGSARGTPRPLLPTPGFAMEHRVHHDPLARDNMGDSRPGLHNPAEDLVSEHRGKRPERLHGRAGLIGDVPQVAPADPAQGDFDPDPVVPRNQRCGPFHHCQSGRPAVHEGPAHAAQALREDESGDRYVEFDGFHRRVR